jgi:hypothetical protein
MWKKAALALKILATRGDGARLVGDEKLDCAMLAASGSPVIISLAAAALAGCWEWLESPALVAVPPHLESIVRQASAKFTAGLASKQPVQVIFTAPVG